MLERKMGYRVWNLFEGMAWMVGSCGWIVRLCLAPFSDSATEWFNASDHPRPENGSIPQTIMRLQLVLNANGR
jgi:hypothetical protein